MSGEFAGLGDDVLFSAAAIHGSNDDDGTKKGTDGEPRRQVFDVTSTSPESRRDGLARAGEEISGVAEALRDLLETIGTGTKEDEWLSRLADRMAELAARFASVDVDSNDDVDFLCAFAARRLVALDASLTTWAGMMLDDESNSRAVYTQRRRVSQRIAEANQLVVELSN